MVLFCDLLLYDCVTRFDRQRIVRFLDWPKIQFDLLVFAQDVSGSYRRGTVAPSGRNGLCNGQTRAPRIATLRAAAWLHEVLIFCCGFSIKGPGKLMSFPLCGGLLQSRRASRKPDMVFHTDTSAYRFHNSPDPDRGLHMGQFPSCRGSCYRLAGSAGNQMQWSEDLSALLLRGRSRKRDLTTAMAFRCCISADVSASER